MAFPVGVSVAIIEAGRAFTSVGSDVSMSAKVTPVFRAVGGGAMKRIVHAATGHPMLASTEEFKAEAGAVLSFAVPHVDQPGWQAPSGEAYTMWYYAVEITARVGNGRNSTGHVWKQNVQPLVGQDFIDLDLVADGPTGEPVTAPQAYVTDVEGQTGSVVIGPIVGAAIDQAVLDGRIPTPQVDVQEIEPGVYDLGTGDPIYGLTSARELPAPAVTQLDARYAEAAAVADAQAAAVTEASGYADTLDTANRSAWATADTAVRDDLTPGNGRRPVGRGELEVSAAEFGAVGDGIMDDTAALNAFFDYITFHQRAGFMPGKNYRITGTLVIPSRAGWSVRGNGNRGTLITQDTDNVPIIQLGDATSFNLNHFSIKGLWFTYKNAQPSTNTNAVCILHYDMPWQATFDDLGFKRGFYGTRVRPGVGCPWGNTWDNIHFGDALTGGAMDWSGGINRVPNNQFGRIYVELGSMIGPVFSIRGYNFIIGTIEFIEATTDAPKLFVFGDSTTVEIGTFKVENTPIAVGKQLIELAGNSYVNIGHLNWKAGGRGTGAFTTGTPYLFSVGSSSAGDTTVHVGNAELEFTAPSTNPAYLMRAGNANTTFTVDRLRTTNGWKAVNNAGNSDGPNSLWVSDLATGRIRTRGDADYAVALRDPNINRFTAAFTAPRTITLPSDGDNLFNGLTYEFIFDGAVNGANTAIIKAGTLTLRTVSTDKVKLQYTYERHGQPASGWKLTAVQSLA